jgi:hypothetical protein
MTGEPKPDEAYREIAEWHRERAMADLRELQARRIPIGAILVAALPPIPAALSGINSETIWPIWGLALITSVALGVFTMRSRLSQPGEEQRDRLGRFIRDLDSIIACERLNDAQRQLVDQAGDTLKKLRGW